ncbi:MAG: DNA-binding protein [Lacunisphaera sp.]|nr:DNA-binding protein [Lacunisphaera sp.]
MAEPRYILDTGPLVAFANAADSHHRWAVETLNSLGQAPVTCEIVLAEACYLLSGSARAVDHILALPILRRVIVEPVITHDSDAVRIAVAKYWPAMDIADGCVLQLASRYPLAKILTTDLRDFRVYRRPDGQSLNLIHPRPSV